MPTNGGFAAGSEAPGTRLQERRGFCPVKTMEGSGRIEADRNDPYKEGIAGTDISFRFGIVEIVTGCRTSVQ